MAFYTYIVASRRNGTLYVGSTDDLAARVYQHREKVRPDSFAARHDVARLVWYEWHETREAAFRRERQFKKWNRLWKLRMIEEMNPGWHDLVDRLAG
ncbi:MAG: GIY-YIG nuclease family protein [Alphaproteobacteria bacterium]|nr:GIY-YIG nuclease family protein [Alphaproteobacteria bacterium]MBU2380265.1 GIY-YIG nuclease family protein [Alphaproteobacteria bacterium]